MLLLLFIQISLNVCLSAYLSPNIRHRPLSHLSIVTFPSNRRAGWGVPNSWRTWSVHRAMPHARHRTSGPRRVARPPLREIARTDDVALGEVGPVHGAGRAEPPRTRGRAACTDLGARWARSLAGSGTAPSSPTSARPRNSAEKCGNSLAAGADAP